MTTHSKRRRGQRLEAGAWVQPPLKPALYVSLLVLVRILVATTAAGKTVAPIVGVAPLRCTAHGLNGCFLISFF
jgi:hypothetical protein